MKDNLIIAWPEDAEDFVFASNTSIVTQKLVEREIFKRYGIKEEL